MSKADIIKELQATYKQRIRTADGRRIKPRICNKTGNGEKKAGELKATVFLCNQNQIEEQRRVARNIRRMEGNMRG